ncbi:MAG: RNA methyltransferase [Clostridiales bacterium]|nr:RNA methyltransferase [Clostridiales bacterium]
MTDFIEITDLSAPELAPYFQLTTRQMRSRQRPENALFVAESPHVIEAALEAGCAPVSMLLEKKQALSHPALMARFSETPIYTAPREVLKSLTGYELTRGILCAFRRPAPVPAERILSTARRVAVLEGIVDPTNVGALFRSAAALGMDAVLLSPTCCDPLHRRSARVSMGAVFRISWAVLGGEPWPNSAMEELKGHGFAAAAMALSQNSVNIDDPALLAEQKLALFLGTEGDGLAAETIAQCDYTVCIPMAHGMDSLNVAAAGAVAFWQLGRGGF